MIILAGGDSFVYGSELDDCQDNHSLNRYGHSLSTFPALLADKNKYECVAWPGYGNDSIARTVIEKCQQLHKEELFVIVSWTFPGRYEFRFNYDTQQRKSPWYTITPWTIQSVDNIKKEFINHIYWVEFDQIESIKRAKNTGIVDFAKIFYSHVGNSEYWEIYSSLKEIVYLQNYLMLNNIPYMFTCADNSILYNYTIDNYDSTVASLHKQIDLDRWFFFPASTDPHGTQKPRGFYQWAVENKYAMGTTHPLEQAHLDAYKLMQEKFNELVTKYIQ